jgi:hypothetical protein
VFSVRVPCARTLEVAAWQLPYRDAAAEDAGGEPRRFDGYRSFSTRLSPSFSYLFSTALQATLWARLSSPYCSSAEL